MTLRCAICMYVPDEPHEAAEAVTVIEGYAVCEDHMSCVAQGEQFSRIINQVRREARHA